MKRKFFYMCIFALMFTLMSNSSCDPSQTGGNSSCDPGHGGGGSSVPLDGGVLLSLLAAGGVGASLFAKSKKKK